MATPSLQRYDAIPYHSAPYAETHPRSLRTIAALLGIDSPKLESARVLELGCAGGGNLLPIAEAFPRARCLGVDLSQRQIEDARQRANQLALSNIEFRQQSLMDLHESDGEFDYLIAHGLFSWVPEEVRLGILQLCRERLSPTGVAVISFNAYPGCHMRDQVRTMMKYHVANMTDPQQQIDEAKSMLQFMASHSKPKTTQHEMLQETLHLLKATNNKSYFYHDFLEDHNQPYYFHEFNSLLKAAGLQVLGETRLTRWRTDDLSREAVAPFVDLPFAEREQYLDFLRNTPFHSYAIAHAEATVERQQVVERMASMHFQWKCERQEMPPRPTPGAALSFHGRRMTLRTESGVGQAALIALGSQPGRVASFTELLTDAALAIGMRSNDPRLRQPLLDTLDAAVGHDLLEIYRDPPKFGQNIVSRPRVANHARIQAAHGNMVTNQCHRYVRLDDLCRFVVLYLDGQHDRDALCQRVRDGIADGRINVASDEAGHSLLPPERLPALVDEVLQIVGQSAMYVA